MSTGTITHREEWVITIRPSGGEEWPLLFQKYTGQAWRPDAITVRLNRAEGGRLHWSTSASGRKLKKDDTLSKNEARETWYESEAMPAWMALLVKQHRAQHGLDGDDNG